MEENEKTLIQVDKFEFQISNYPIYVETKDVEIQYILEEEIPLYKDKIQSLKDCVVFDKEIYTHEGLKTSKVLGRKLKDGSIEPVYSGRKNREYVYINGQLLYTSAVPALKNQIKTELKKFFSKSLGDSIVQISNKCNIDITFYDKRFGGEADPDNHALFYMKTLLDVLVEKGILEDDNRDYIKSINLKFEDLDSNSRVINKIGCKLYV